MFEIIIVEIKTEEKTEDGNYGVIDKRLITEKDLAGSAYAAKEEFTQKLLSGEPIFFEIRGYAPDRKVEVETKHEILKQRVADIDLAAVIKAVNKIA